MRYHRVFMVFLHICNVWLSLKTLYSKVMASFAYHCCLPYSLISSQQIAIRNSFSRRRVRTFSDSSCEMTNSSLTIFNAKELHNFLPFFCAGQLAWHMWYTCTCACRYSSISVGSSGSSILCTWQANFN